MARKEKEAKSVQVSTDRGASEGSVLTASLWGVGSPTSSSVSSQNGCECGPTPTTDYPSHHHLSIIKRTYKTHNTAQSFEPNFRKNKHYYKKNKGWADDGRHKQSGEETWTKLELHVSHTCHCNTVKPHWTLCSLVSLNLSDIARAVNLRVRLKSEKHHKTEDFTLHGIFTWKLLSCVEKIMVLHNRVLATCKGKSPVPKWWMIIENNDSNPLQTCSLTIYQTAVEQAENESLICEKNKINPLWVK